jgi:hypothetical protein
VGIKNLVYAEVKHLFTRGARLVVAQRPRGAAIFTRQTRDMRSGDRFLEKGSVVRAVTDEAEYTISKIGWDDYALVSSDDPSSPFHKGVKAVIAGARSHDGLAFDQYIAFHQDCGTEISAPSIKVRITTGAIQHLYIGEEQIF